MAWEEGRLIQTNQKRKLKCPNTSTEIKEKRKEKTPKRETLVTGE